MTTNNLWLMINLKRLDNGFSLKVNGYQDEADKRCEKYYKTFEEAQQAALEFAENFISKMTEDEYDKEWKY